MWWRNRFLALMGVLILATTVQAARIKPMPTPTELASKTAPKEEAKPVPNEKPTPEEPADKSEEPDFDPEAGGQEAKHIKPRVIIGADFYSKEHSTLESLVVLFGNATVNGPVENDCVVIFGNLTLNNRVGGDVVTLFGKQTLGPKADVRGDLVMIGGSQKLDEATKVGGERVVIGLGECSEKLNFFWNWVREALLKGRPVAPSLSWNWAVVAVFAMMYLGLGLLFPGAVQAGVRQLENRPASAFLSGLAGLVLAAPLLLILLISVLGAPVMLLLLVAVVSGLFLGRAVLLVHLGYRLTQALGGRDRVPPLLALLLGAAVLAGLYVVPLVGFLVWGATLVWGFGAVLLLLEETFRREKRPSTPLPTPEPVALSVTPDAGTDGSIPPRLPEELALAELGTRVKAILIDAVILAVVANFVPKVSDTLLWIVYEVVLVGWKGTTLGGIIMDIRCVRVDGRPMDWTTAFVRSVASLLSALIFALGYFWAWWDPQRQTWHDRIAGTRVVKSTKVQSLV